MKLNSVQYLRGLAAVLVVIAHAADHPLSQPSVVLENIGELGVTLFFVISGFIMVAISGNGRFLALQFLRRRAIRVIPLYWIFTTLAAVLALFLPAMFKSTIFTWPHYLQSMLFIPHEAPGRGGYSPLLSLGWTLNYEIFFYLAFAACAVLGAFSRVAVLTLVFGALSIAGLVFKPDNIVLSFYANVSLLAFCVGAWIGLAFIHGYIGRIPLRAAIITGLLGIVMLLAGLANEGGMTFIALLFASAMVLLSGIRLEAVLPRSRLLEKLGDASYSTYLVHMFVVGAVVTTASRLLPMNDAVEYWGAVVSAILMAIVAGIVVHNLVEKPLLRLCGVRLAGIKPSRVDLAPSTA